MNETSRQPPKDEVPPGDEPQPRRTEEQARIAKLAAEKALIREQLKRAALENEATEREAKAWHSRYTFVPSPRVALQAIGAGVVFVIAFFAFYQPLVDRIKFDAEEEAKIEKRRAENQGIIAERRQLENKRLSEELDEQKKQQNATEEKLRKQEERYKVELEGLANRLEKTEKSLSETVQLAKKWQKQAIDRTREYKKLADESETYNARFQKLAREEQERADELAKLLPSLQTKARTAKEQAKEVQEEIIAAQKIDVTMTSNFELVWNDRGSGANLDGSFWRPKPPDGYAILGHVNHASWADPKKSVLVVKIPDNMTKQKSLLAYPSDYTMIWDNKGSGAKKDCAVWRAQCPSGYVPLGDVAIPHYSKPSTNEIVCVREDRTEKGSIGRPLWNDRGSGAYQDLSCWKVEPHNRITGIDAGMFQAVGDRKGESLPVLKKSVLVGLEQSKK